MGNRTRTILLTGSLVLSGLHLPAALRAALAPTPGHDGGQGVAAEHAPDPSGTVLTADLVSLAAGDQARPKHLDRER